MKYDGRSAIASDVYDLQGFGGCWEWFLIELSQKSCKMYDFGHFYQKYAKKSYKIHHFCVLIKNCQESYTPHDFWSLSLNNVKSRAEYTTFGQSHWIISIIVDIAQLFVTLKE